MARAFVSSRHVHGTQGRAGRSDPGFGLATISDQGRATAAPGIARSVVAPDAMTLTPLYDPLLCSSDTVCNTTSDWRKDSAPLPNSNSTPIGPFSPVARRCF